MQPPIHFLVSIVAGLGVGLHLENKKKKYLLIIVMAIAATCIDLDHLLPVYQETGVKMFHNVFVFVIFPAALFLTFCVYERGKGSTIGQRACMLLCVMFVGHMFLDGISKSGVPLLYPFRSERFTMSNLGITINQSFFTLTSEQVIMIFWGAMILCGNIVETIIYNDVEGKKPLEFNLKSYRTRNKRRKSWLPVVVNGMPFIKKQTVRTYKSSDEVFEENKDPASHEEVVDHSLNLVAELNDLIQEYNYTALGKVIKEQILALIDESNDVFQENKDTAPGKGGTEQIFNPIFESDDVPQEKTDIPSGKELTEYIFNLVDSMPD